MVVWRGNRPDFESAHDKQARERQETRAAVEHEREKRMARKAKGVTHEQILAEGDHGRRGAEENEENRKGWITKAIQSARHHHDDGGGGGHSKKRHRSHSHSA